MVGTSNYGPRFLPARLPRLCVAIAATNPAELVQKADVAVRENPFVEFRLDYLPKPALGLQKLKTFVEYHPEALIVATCRRVAAGGRFRGSIAAEVQLLTKAAQQGCHLLDIELETAERLKPADFDKLRRSANLIISFHDYKATKKLEDILGRMRKYPADFFKIVTTANSLYDNVVMMKFLEKHSSEYSLIGACMGEQGVISRILGVRAGSQFTFAAVNPGEETAPGQLTARALRETFRIDQVDAATRVYGVVGDPVAHSLSPAMLNTAFRRENVNGVYLALHARSLDDLLACIRDIPIAGLSVTMPYKEEIVKHLDKTDPLTTKIGACNTVVRGQDGKLYGFNTDVGGVVRPLETRIRLQGARILVLGAGGSARAAVFGLKERGAEVFILNRTPGPAQTLARQAKAKAINRTMLKKMEFDVIVNATPVGMEGNRDPLPISEDEFKARYFFEMVYSPSETRMVKVARAKGMHVILGVEMFVQQGARQFEIWSGKPAPVLEMQRVVEYALAQREAAKAANNGKASGKRAGK
ncbi:MAG TPA: shikimate dehydrogenase [Candidatus Angelobacter sp.]|jgi:3-dehydroquinate dehydratase/shikimate dehydrogenase|nr:shikimate dehydrogenase [Candidatus Angelobacter sp.]